MASSSTPLHIIDDDDEFDWEAAVQEIDVAFQIRDTSNGKPISNSYKFDCNSSIALNPFQNVHEKENFNVNLSSVSSTRQCTLDRFIGVPSSNLKKSVENAEFIDSNGDRNGGNVECEGVQVLNGFVKIDAEAAKTWIYPVNIPLRDYQFSITRTALFSNTLVVLPTGLGKTLIAAVVMYNYFRWFPEGKIVFAAPSRPLVMQQIEACHNIVGIPQEWTIDLTGKTNPIRRAVFWKNKRVFFVTPQVLEKDIQSGSCLVKHLVCLVIDEAHRATGNYAYCVAVRELMDAPVQLRILALTATPGSKHQAIQVIINNLQISTLEYRSESDPDVLPYVHERKLEVIKVPLGDEAVKIYTLFLEVVRPLVTRLSSYGVLPNRDPQTLSPCDFLDSREKFRNEHPPAHPHEKYGDIESCYGALLTLYHIRKLLSSHGIKPAFELLDEKLKQGNFARMVIRNEALLKAKLLMQKTISHGAPSPKLAKLLEVLIDHFKVKDPQNSRVIIFSNFRGSVRDIMNSLANLGELVKATEFIGQSSGKNLKGQSQKVQQAVLEKFRTGGYNVIVATSIGEEGLDIMEVDLVICFDANVSSLRMIQRMGRTGRKHEGRVVILACEGSEMKGYMRNKANSKAIKKHMHNGGMNSFSFHSSPRMIPHIFKPEVKFLEMLIEEFIPRGKKMKDDNFMLEPPVYQKKLTDAETVLLAKYFAPKAEISRRPSLTAFPHFQAFPSPVNKVAHSSRTGLLIDTMQYLQGMSFCKDTETLFNEDEDILDPCSRVDMMEPLILRERFDDANEEYLETKVVQLDIEIEENVKNAAVHIGDPQKQKPRSHSFMFSSEFVSVDDLGNVLILSLPQLPMVSHSKCINNTNHDDNTMQEKNNPSSQSSCPKEKDMLETSLMPQKILQTPVSNRKSEEMRISGEDHNVANDEIDMQLAGESSECRDSELSPRLTIFIESGVVPESPINNEEATWSNRSISTPRALFSSQDLKRGFLTTSWQQDDEAVRVGTLREMDAPCFSGDDIQTRGLYLDNNEPKECTPPVPVGKETQTPCAKLSNTSSRDSLFDSGVKPETVEQQCKFRRLRKLADINEEVCPESNERTGRNRKLKCCRVNGQKKQAKDVVVYIEDEAEISSDAMASDDEEDGPENSSYEDSFIDDGTNPASASTQAGCSNMMAVYRRSLLTQSPFPRLPNISTNFSPDTVVQHTRLDESSSPRSKDSLVQHTPQTGRNSQITCDKISTELIKNDNKPDSRKRKLSCYQAPVVNLYKDFSLLSKAAAENTSMQIQIDKLEKDVFLDEDDQFLQGIDLDAVEEEAAKQLRYRSEYSMQKTPAHANIQRNFGILGSPSFDLGI